MMSSASSDSAAAASSGGAALAAAPAAAAAMLAFCRSPHFLGSVCALVIAAIVMGACRVPLQWWWMLLFAAVTVPFSPWASNPLNFFRGGIVSDSEQGARNWVVLSCSAFVSWIFAKGILNASTLGASFGVVGGLAYASYFVAFFTVAGVGYVIRTRHGYRSLPEAIHARYGGAAALAFALAVAYRLEQEVWSNSLVVAGFYGPVGSGPWWIAAVVSTAIPALYCFTGGMRASLLTDVLQALIKILFVVAVVGVVGAALPKSTSFATFNKAGSCKLAAPTAAPFSKASCTALNLQPLNATGGLTCPDKSVAAFTPAGCNYTAINSSDVCAAAAGVWAPPACFVSQQPACAAAGGAWAPRTMWSLEGGGDLLLVGLLQGALSYPFFDPVLTDRAFLGQPAVMAKSFVLGGIAAILVIFLFSFVGIFGAAQAVLRPDTVPCELYAGMLGGQPAAVAHFLGPAVFQVVNIIFLVSSCSVLDSTFASTAKLFGPELFGALRRGRPLPPQMATQRHAIAGRIAIVLMAIVGTLPLLAGPSALDATTISGTMVVGMGPPVFALMLGKRRSYQPLAFHLPFFCGMAFGVVMQLSTSPCCKHTMDVSGFAIGKGKYASLLGFNVVSAVCCWVLGGLALLDNRAGRRLEGAGEDEADDEALAEALQVAAATKIAGASESGGHGKAPAAGWRLAVPALFKRRASPDASTDSSLPKDADVA